ncbi:MAG: GAF domain-containing protein, partial [Pedobacter sp.]
MSNKDKNTINPSSEELRLAALQRYRIFNSGDEPGFRHICQLASTIFKVPIAHISFLGENQEFVKEQVGLSKTLRYVDRKHSLCSLAVLDATLTVIEDAATDHRLAD